MGLAPFQFKVRLSKSLSCLRASPSYSCCIFPALDLCWDPTRKVYIRKRRNSWLWIGVSKQFYPVLRMCPVHLPFLFNFWCLILLVPTERCFQQSASTFHFPTKCFQPLLFLVMTECSPEVGTERLWLLWQSATYLAFLQWQQQACLLLASLPSVEISVYQEGLRAFCVWRDQAHAGSVQIHTSSCFSEDSSEVTSWKPLKSFCMISHGFILFVDAEGWKLALQPERLCLLWALNRWMNLVREGIIRSTPTFQTFGPCTAQFWQCLVLHPKLLSKHSVWLNITHLGEAKKPE